MYCQLHDFISHLLPNHGVNLSELDRQIKEREIGKGEYLFQEGNVCQFVGFNIKGCFRVFFLKDGKEITFDFFCENRFIVDYESYFRQHPTRFYFQAVEHSTLLILNDACIEMLFEQPSEGQRLQRIILETVFFRFRDQLLSLYTDKPEERYLNLLHSEPELVKRVSQYHLASYLGIEPESLSRLKRRVLRADKTNSAILNPSQ
jgi:CRP-like cAMP-binding protein